MSNENVVERLKGATEACVKVYEDWMSKGKDSRLKPELEEAVHELRKVASRIEIEIATSEGGNKSQKPIPIPAHRSARGSKGANVSPQGPKGNESADGNSAAKSDAVASATSKLKKSGGARKTLSAGSAAKQSEEK